MAIREAAILEYAFYTCVYSTLVEGNCMYKKEFYRLMNTHYVCSIKCKKGFGRRSETDIYVCVREGCPLVESR